MNIGRMIFFDKITGERIVDTGQWENIKVQKTVNQQIDTYKELSERNRGTFDVLELPFGAYAQDFAECNGFRVNVTGGTLEFSYPDPNTPDASPIFVKPLTEHIADLESRNIDLMLAIAEMAEATEQAKTESQLAIAELAEIIAGGA